MQKVTKIITNWSTVQEVECFLQHYPTEIGFKQDLCKEVQLWDQEKYWIREKQRIKLSGIGPDD